ncbi:MAG: TonB-dependent receptor [Gemmatimonadetes bacterium]|nr:TonB-dependent receptor [Gemmatimonadota bacterium]
MPPYRVCLPAAAALLLAAPPAPAQTLVRGRLLDDASGSPIPRATVVLSANRGRWQSATLTDSAGGFAFADVSAGPYRLRAGRVGYRDAVGQLGLSADSLVEVELRMAVASVVLAPVTVVSRSTRDVSPVLRGFYSRMQNGAGRFITREEIEARHPVRITDMLRNIPNLRASPPRMGTSGSGFSQGSNADRCTVVFFVDGMQVNQPAMTGFRATPRQDMAIDDYVQPDEVEGVEVYRGESDTPAEFSTRWVQCGTVVIWTRRGFRARG